MAQFYYAIIAFSKKKILFALKSITYHLIRSITKRMQMVIGHFYILINQSYSLNTQKNEVFSVAILLGNVRLDFIYLRLI